MWGRRIFSLFVMSGLLWGFQAKAQQAPDLIAYNAKIVTVDDDSFTSELGSIVQAMAVRDGKILAVGTNAEVRGRAGPATRMWDLRGRTVLPGLIGVHDHPYDWNHLNPYSLKKVLTDDVVVTRYIEGSPEEQLQAFPEVMKEAVSKAKPGQWIYIVFPFGKMYEHGPGGNVGVGGIPGQGKMSLFGGVTAEGAQGEFTKADLDAMAPNNPVLLRDVFVGLAASSKALEQIDAVFPPDVTSQINHETGAGGANAMRWAFSDVVMRDHYEELRELQRLGLSWWAGYGMTAYGSAAYQPSNLKVYADLVERGEMPIRTMWAWNWRPQVFYEDRFWIKAFVSELGQGNDYVWNGGGWPGLGLGCSTLEPRIELPPAATTCGLAPGSEPAKWLYEYIKAGGRFATAHFTMDRDIDHVLEIIERASRDAGFTPEQIRAKRHTIDHLGFGPRPDQLPRIKKLGMVLGGNPFEIHESAPGVLQVYGEKPLDWVVPKGALVKAGIPSGFEVDRALSTTNLTMFWTLAKAITRKGWDGKIYGQSQAISRELALKTITTWGAYYLLRENLIGSLEPGKWADFIVIDRDYLTIPQDQIQDIRVLMTVLGGKVVHLVPSLAKETGMQRTGAQVELGGAAAQW